VLGEPVKTTGEQAYFNEIKGIFVERVRCCNRSLQRLHEPSPSSSCAPRECPGSFPKHERVGKLRHYGVLNIFRERAAS